MGQKQKTEKKKKKTERLNDGNNMPPQVAHTKLSGPGPKLTKKYS